MTAHALADGLVGFALDRVERLAAAHFPAWRLPRLFAGHAVGPDVRADLAFTLGHLWRNGVTAVAGTPVDAAIARVLRPIDGARTHTFFSYRVAETLARFGPFADNPLLRGWTASERENVAVACDSSASLPGLDDGSLPRNYAAVLARCEVARAALGLVGDDDPVLASLVERVRSMLDAGLLDDSRDGIGRYDIYAADVVLFTEPLAPGLGRAWPDAAERVLELFSPLVASNGAAVTWGRSSGALALCLTVELAGLAASVGAGAEARWLTPASAALAELHRWFGPDGVVSAHQYRSTYGYRGPARRLQMTLDCLGKLVDAAAALRAGPDVAGVPSDEWLADRDHLVSFDDDDDDDGGGEDRSCNASVWTFRSPATAFVLPFVGGTVSDYLPALRNPGLFEVPVDADLPTGVPLVVRGARRYTAGGLPAAVVAGPEPGTLTVRHEGWLQTNHLERPADALPGSRVATYRVEGRTIHVHEHLRFTGKLPHSVALAVAEADGRPLHVAFAVPASTGHAATTIATAGVAEWRSYWGELPVVHQVDVDPAPELRFGWSVTPKLRVLTTAHEHHYHRSLYDPLVRDGLVIDGRLALGRVDDGAYLRDLLGRWDQFHLHWPEWFLGADVDRHARFIDALAASGVRVVWTQHNLVPHSRDPRLVDVYTRWAAAADAVLHHSEWGRDRVTARYPFRPDAVHAVVPHPHFGHYAAGAAPVPGKRLRLGVVGAPRPEKDTRLVMEAVARSRRDDVELHVFSLDAGEAPVDDPRIVTAEPYTMVPRPVYEERLAALDVVVLPFGDGGELLTTGIVGDVVAHGLPALVSPWPFLREVLGDAGLPFGTTAEDLARTIDGLTPQVLARAAAASRALQPALASDAVAAKLFAVLDALGTARI